MKRLLFASLLMCSPAYALDYEQGVSFGSWSAFCQAHRFNDYKDPGLAKHMTFAAYDALDEENKAWARDIFPECTPNQ